MSVKKETLASQELQDPLEKRVPQEKMGPKGTWVQ